MNHSKGSDMAKSRPILGRIKCLGCGREAAAKEQGGTGYACYSCPWCSLFVQAHAPEADKFLRARITALEPGERVPGEAPPRPAAQEQRDEREPAAAEPTIFDLLKPRGAKA